MPAIEMSANLQYKLGMKKTRAHYRWSTRTDTIQVRLDQKEKDEIAAAAHAAGLSVSAWVRLTLLSEARKMGSS